MKSQLLLSGKRMYVLRDVLIYCLYVINLKANLSEILKLECMQRKASATRAGLDQLSECHVPFCLLRYDALRESVN